MEEGEGRGGGGGGGGEHLEKLTTGLFSHEEPENLPSFLFPNGCKGTRDIVVWSMKELCKHDRGRNRFCSSLFLLLANVE